MFVCASPSSTMAAYTSSSDAIAAAHSANVPKPVETQRVILCEFMDAPFVTEAKSHLRSVQRTMPRSTDSCERWLLEECLGPQGTRIPRENP
jgi:hypothetical protein